jgi:hypothetical protein
MMADSGRSAFRFALAAALSASATAAIATPQYLIVGDGSQNQHCQYATIQDAIDAAAANGPDLDYVMITSTVGHTGQELRVLNQNVLIEGGYLDCELNPGSMPTAIIGDGVHSVLTLASSDGSFHEMRVRNLDISLGGGGTETERYLRIAMLRFLLLQTHDWSDEIAERLADQVKSPSAGAEKDTMTHQIIKELRD